MAVKPITGMLRRGLVTDLGIAMGLGVTFGSLYWYEDPVMSLIVAVACCGWDEFAMRGWN
ncbi:hypothetical protein GGR52DRAFT_577343 [Hypoxylon sp. FL1284]|nr:hypothetical protein GGR52DRAFT_577343 [Hypoxylon sp. FL1284]